MSEPFEPNDPLHVKFRKYPFEIPRNKDEAVKTIKAFADKAAITTHAFQAGGVERDVCKTYSLRHYWPEDIDRGEEKFVTPLDELGDLALMCDVDYYVEWDETPIELYNRPILIYTLDVAKPGYNDKLRRWSFNSQDEIEMLVGARRYRHKLWNYHDKSYVQLKFSPGADVCSKIADSINKMLHRAKSLMYRVDVRNLPNTVYKLVLLTPVPLPPRNCLKELLGLQRLPKAEKIERLKVSCIGANHHWCITRRFRQGNDELWFCLEGDTQSYYIPWTIYLVYRSIKQLMQGTIQDAWRKEVKKEIQPIHLNAVNLFLKDVCDVETIIPTVVLYDYGTVDPRHTKGGVAALPIAPLLPAPAAPLNTRENLAVAVQERIIGIRPEVELTDQLRRYIDWFVRAVDPPAATPLSDEELMDKCTPTQRGTLIRSDACLTENLPVSGFLKMEASKADGKLDPRVITHVDNKTKLEYLKYIHGFKTCVSSKYCCFASGKDPVSIANRVKSICGREGAVLETDFSRMDGRKSAIGRYLYSSLLHHAFLKTSEDHARRAVELHESTVGMKVKSDHGLSWTNGFALGSGSPDTTDNNSWETLFVLFYSRLKEENFNQDRAYEWALESTIISGDDSLAVGLSQVDFEAGARELGHSPKSATKNDDETFSFLARHYGGKRLVLEDIQPYSCQDPRCLLKISCSTSISINSTQKNLESKKVDNLVERACAYLLSDPETPILSQYCRFIINTYSEDPYMYYDKFGLIKLEYCDHTSWNYNLSMTSRYPNARKEWMLKVYGKAFEGFGISDLETALDGCKTKDDLIAISTQIHNVLDVDLSEAYPKVDLVYMTSEGQIDVKHGKQKIPVTVEDPLLPSRENFPAKLRRLATTPVCEASTSAQELARPSSGGNQQEHGKESKDKCKAQKRPDAAKKSKRKHPKNAISRPKNGARAVPVQLPPRGKDRTPVLT
uniref:RNA replicase n=1 Tax=Beihai noda-like virus 1 TaxID=1922462 RepID=A0A1L3KFL8_9VIRU|nr:hypothetical protein 1 [Beihai noda-like virus 1]